MPVQRADEALGYLRYGGDQNRSAGREAGFRDVGLQHEVERGIEHGLGRRRASGEPKLEGMLRHAKAIAQRRVSADQLGGPRKQARLQLRLHKPVTPQTACQSPCSSLTTQAAV